MKDTRNFKLVLPGIVMAAAVFGASPASASYIADWGGIMVPTGSGSFGGTGYETQLTYTNSPLTQLLNQTLSGYGSIDKFQSGSTALSGSNLCSSGGKCGLTYQFGGYQVNSVASNPDGTYTLGFKGGWVNVYYQSTMPTTLDYSGAVTSTPWLTLAGKSFSATLNNANGQYTLIGNSSVPGYGGGFLNVTDNTSGVANRYFNTNNVPVSLYPQLNIGDFVDLSLGITTTNNTGPSSYPISNSVNGSYYAVPEPNDLGIMGLGLLMLGLLGLRVRQSRFRRD